MALILALAVVFGMSVDDGGPAAAAESAAIVYLLFVIWRSILMGFGAFAPAEKVPIDPETVDAPDAGGTGCALLGAAGVLAGLVLAKVFGKLLREWLQHL